MALSFNESKGSAQKSDLKSYDMKRNGEHTVRVVGDILPRYLYWIKGENNKDIPFECLSFDREAERFTNQEKDWVRTYFPKMKCSWGYATQCISDGEVMVFNLKKKLWEQVISAAQDLGDPTDPKTGWDIVFERKKTGPLPYNVEYNLLPLRCKKRPLTDEELELIEDLKSMDEVLPRPTPDAQRELLERITSGGNEEIDEEALEEDIDF